MIFFRLAVILITALFAATACSPSPATSNKLVIGIGSTLNLGNNNPVFIQRNANVWETLTELDDTLTPRPSLAQSWEVSSDGRQWTFHLKRGVTFHNGDRLNSRLVTANLLRMKNHPELDYYSTFSSLVSAVPKDEWTIHLEFSSPVVDLPNRLGHYFAGVFSPRAFGPDGKLDRPIGSGPYIYSQSRIGQYDRVTAFAQYHGVKPHFGEIEFKIIGDPAVRIMSLLRGDIDMIAHHGGVPPSYLDMLKDRRDIVVAAQDVAITHYLLFNCARHPFSDPASRDAFSRALDRHELARLILHGSGIAARDFLVETAVRWNRNRFSLLPETDEPVKRQLAALGKGNALTLLLSQGDASSWSYRHTADYLSDYFAKLGVSIRIEMLESGAWQKATQAGDFDLTLYPLSLPTGIPDLLVRRLAYSKGMQVRSIGNTTHYASAPLDALFEKALNAPNVSAHDQAYHSLLDLLAEEKPFVPLYHERYYYAYRQGLTGIHIDPFLKMDLGAIRFAGERE
jgi:peptide/nickel transport system substrate-binding protein